MVLLVLALVACDSPPEESAVQETEEIYTWPTGWEYRGVCYAHESDETDCVYSSNGDSKSLGEADNIKVVTCDADDVAEGWDCIYDSLNSLGEDGWELVPSSQDVFMFDYDIVYTLKRPLWD